MNDAVFIVDNGKAARLSITRGMTTATGEVEIKKGLRGGEDLILNPPPTLKEGDRVTPRQQNP